MTKVKKVLFYSLFSQGHLNVCASIGSLLLNNHSDQFQVYFVVDAEWEAKLSKRDDRFRFAVIKYENKDQETRLVTLVTKIKDQIRLPFAERFEQAWKGFREDPSLMAIDEKAEEQIRLINPDFVLCDHVFHLPAMYSTGIPFAFIHSSNPLIFSFDGYPKIGSDAGVDEYEKLKEYDRFFSELRKYSVQKTRENFEERGVQTPTDVELDAPLCKTFQIYMFPTEIDYYDEQMKEHHQLWQIDSPLFKERIPAPYELPEEFRNLPETKTVFVSLGSVFSIYTDLLQRLVDALDKVPGCKFIVSNGDKVKLPSKRFIGQAWFDQLAVLQVCDAMVAHGGNNSLSECFYFGVPCLIIPAFADQINNATRIEETGFGYKLDTLNFTDQELTDKLRGILDDQKLRKRWSGASRRIQSENRIVKVVERIADFVQEL